MKIFLNGVDLKGERVTEVVELDGMNPIESKHSYQSVKIRTDSELAFERDACVIKLEEINSELIHDTNAQRVEIRELKSVIDTQPATPYFTDGEANEHRKKIQKLKGELGIERAARIHSDKRNFELEMQNRELKNYPTMILSTGKAERMKKQQEQIKTLEEGVKVSRRCNKNMHLRLNNLERKPKSPDYLEANLAVSCKKHDENYLLKRGPILSDFWTGFLLASGSIMAVSLLLERLF